MLVTSWGREDNAAPVKLTFPLQSGSLWPLKSVHVLEISLTQRVALAPLPVPQQLSGVAEGQLVGEQLLNGGAGDATEIQTSSLQVGAQAGWGKIMACRVFRCHRNPFHFQLHLQNLLSSQVWVASIPVVHDILKHKGFLLNPGGGKKSLWGTAAVFKLRAHQGFSIVLDVTDLVLIVPGTLWKAYGGWSSILFPGIRASIEGQVFRKGFLFSSVIQLAVTGVLSVILQLSLKEPEARVLQIVHTQSVGAQNDLVDVFSTQHQLGSVGKLEQRSKAFGCDLKRQNDGLLVWKLNSKCARRFNLKIWREKLYTNMLHLEPV